MFTNSTPSLRRLSGFMLPLVLFCAAVRKGAAQTIPAVTASFAQTLAPPTGLGTIYQTAIDSYGDLLVVDDGNGALYEYPAGGGTAITLIAAGALGTANPGIAIGAANDLYLEANYNNCLLRFPYDTTTHTWDGLATVTSTNTTADICPNAGGGTSPYIFAQYSLTISGTYPGYYQPWAIAVDSNNNLVIASQNSGNFIDTLTVNGTGAASTVGPGSMILDKMGARAQSITTDKYGNIYFVEETDGATLAPPEAPLPGVYMIPAGSGELASDAGLVRVDPNLPAVSGVATDAAGNLYISDSDDGVYFVPNPSGTPETSQAQILTPVPANGQVSIDAARHILYVPTSSGGSEAIDAVTFNAAALGSVAAGTAATTPQAVSFGFNASTTPASFAIQEAGATTPDFNIASGGSCAAGTADAADSGCTVDVTLSPHAAGNVSAKLLMLDASGNVLSSFTLQGTGTGSAVQVLPGGESTIGAGLKTPAQVAVDAAGNTYVADPGAGAVEVFPKGSGAVGAAKTVGTGLTAPTGVAVDGGGDVFIADSGNVIEVPIGASGLNAAGQFTLKSGLGTHLNLATDGLGDLFVADPDNHRVVKLANPGGSAGLLAQTETDLTGYNAPSAVAVDASGDLFVADGSNLDEVTPAGVQSTVLTTLSGATGLAVDPSGSVYVAMPSGVLRIPNEAGTLNPADATTVASDVAGPTSVAVDSAENVYVTGASSGDVEMVSSSASTNFGTLTSTTGSATQSYTILDAGNAPLNISGFGNTPDYTATSSTCVGTAIAIDSTCPVTVTFNPGPGDQGTLVGPVLVQSDAANSPVGVNVTGVGAALAGSATTVKVTNATVDGAPAVITVAPTASSGATPTGLVTLTITGSNLTTPVVVPGTLVNGTVTIAPPQLAAGSYAFNVAYQGDRTYGTSSASVNVTVGVGAVTLIQPSMAAVQAANPNYPLILANGNGADEPYDGSIAPYYYTYPVQVVATDGDPLIGQPIYDPTGKLIGENYGSVIYQVVEVSPVAGGTGGGTGCQPVPVAADGTAPLSTNCVAIDTSNDAIPDLQTTYTITPMYSPVGPGGTNPNYAPVTGTPINFTALRNPVVQISSSSTSLTASSGSPATATLTLTSLFGFGFVGGGNKPPAGSVQEPGGGLLNNYSLPVQLACDGLPAYATCSFSYATPDSSDPNSTAVGPVTGTTLPGMTSPCAANVGCVGPGIVTMTITTNVPTGEQAGLRGGPGAVTFAGLFGLGLLGLAFGKKKPLRGRIPTLMGVLLCCGIISVAGGVSGCSTKQLGTNSSTTTPAGTYTISVTAKQVGSRTIPVSQANPQGIVYGNENQMSLPFTMKLTIQ